METTTVVSSSSPSEQDGDVPSSFYNGLDPSKVQSMLDACGVGNMGRIQELCREDALYARQQDYRTGKSPLMMAASAGYGPVCRWLLEEQGAPWNAVDRQGQCAGNYATNAQHWDVVNLLVDFATQAELILGAIQRNNRQNQQQQQQQQHATTTLDAPVQHQPSTKPDYLRQRLTYTKDALLDKDKDAVMMEWERPLMEAHAQILMESIPGQQQPRRVLNVGFGMGIIDTILQERYNPSLHVIVEAHPDVYQRMLDEGWNTKPNVRICFGTWQTVLPTLIRDEQLRVDAVFYDTYGEHFTDLEDFHRNIVVPILAKPHGIYSFFNGLAPDNLFFHGVGTFSFSLLRPL